MEVLFFLVSFGACLIGATCGMGGGIIIKPVLDAVGAMSPSTVNFLSGCTVIGMTLWNVGKTLNNHESAIDLRNSSFLGVGAAIGGIAGKELFTAVAGLFTNPNLAGGVQAAVLLLATVATFLYTIKKKDIPSRQVKNPAAVVIIGLALGVLGAFLGIGGGPFNIAVMYYFFSMPTKTATQNSLYIILISQSAFILKTITSGQTPVFVWWVLLGMVFFGIAGSECGRRLHRGMTEKTATLSFEGSMILIMVINVYNIIKFFWLS